MKSIGRNVKLLIALVGTIDLVEGVSLAFLPNTLGQLVWLHAIEDYEAQYYAAPYLAIALAALFVLRESDWDRVRIVFPPAIFFTGYMLAIALTSLNSEDGFPTARLATFGFLASYAAALIGGIVFYWRYERL